MIPPMYSRSTPIPGTENVIFEEMTLDVLFSLNRTDLKLSRNIRKSNLFQHITKTKKTQKRIN